MKKIKVASCLALTGLALCWGATRVADAGYYSSPNPAYFACDTYVRSDRQYGYVYSANFECDGGADQKVELFSVMYCRNKSTGAGGSRVEYSNSAEGDNPYTEVNCYPSNETEEISKIISIHNGYWNGIRQTINTSDG